MNIKIAWKETEKLFEVTFSSFSLKMVNDIKQIGGRRWDADKKAWLIPIVSSLDFLEKFIKPYRAQIDDEDVKRIKTAINNYRETKQFSVQAENDKVNQNQYLVPDGKEYFPFQKIAIEWLERTGGNALIADEMGCGKTIEVIGWINQHQNINPIIIVCPASLKLNWEKEINRWAINPGKIVIVNKETHDLDGRFYIINYDILKHFVYIGKKGDVPKEKQVPYNPLFYKIHAQILIMDESHYIKDKSALRTKCALKLAKMTPHRVALTGTPFLNRPIELYTIANMLAPVHFSNWRYYTERYCGAFQDRWGHWNIKGHSNENELNSLLRSTIMIRRRKEDVIKDLPPKTRAFVPLECGATPAYRVLEGEIIDELLYLNIVKNKDENDSLVKKAKMNILTAITKARAEIFELKKEQLLDFIVDTLDNEEHLVIFVYHHAAYNYLMAELKKKKISVTGFMGETDMRDRQIAIDEFQDGKYRVFITSTGAGAFGITLTRAKTLIFAELDWSLANTMQSEDRIHRIGQKENVNIYFLIDEDSIEGYIASLLEEKLKTFKNIIDGDAVVIKEDYFGNLFEWAKRRKELSKLNKE